VLLALALVDLLELSIKILIFVVIVQVVLSWFGRGSPLEYVVDAITRPLLRPIRRLVPPIANVDLSPMVLMLVLLILLVPVAELRKLAGGLF
jgi:YggT family protein